ncbi:MAG: 30S ribosomal protein S16 [Actinobacteria bacterium]|uniref:Unannotated protein n=1 Tax=freshwater metagenome TaxID=449393 RepID=A0A6J6W8E5_9ZZZZ|nr:30S ribosomal protein S16 [Actinomycetota bacterium]MSY06526.1 30S ribosomal protein S16 [Actinomycetota bacterium]
MAVKIRLMRVGKKKQPTYRVVVADSRSPRDGRYIEIIGQYEPRKDPSVFAIDNDKALGWLRKGAQPTEQVHKLLIGTGLWAEFEAASPNPTLATRTAKARKLGTTKARAIKDEAAKAEAAANAAAESAAKAAEAKAAAEAAKAAAESAAEEVAEEATEEVAEDAAAEVSE